MGESGGARREGNKGRKSEDGRRGPKASRGGDVNNNERKS